MFWSGVGSCSRSEIVPLSLWEDIKSIEFLGNINGNIKELVDERFDLSLSRDPARPLPLVDLHPERLPRLSLPLRDERAKQTRLTQTSSSTALRTGFDLEVGGVSNEGVMGEDDGGGEREVI